MEVTNRVRLTAEVLDHLRDGVMVVDHAEQVQLVNRSFRTIFERAGLSTGTETGAWPGILRRHGDFCPVQRVLARREPVRDEDFCLEGPLGQRHLYLRAVPWREPAGDAPGVVVMIADRTERRDLKATIRQQERLAALGEMAAAAAHEIRNPLASIKGYLQLMERGADAPAREGYYRIILREIGRLEAIVADMLDAGSVRDLRLEELDVARLLEETARFAAATSADVTVELRGLDAGQPRAYADAGRLKQVLDNLVKNAVEATGPGGAIQLAAQVEGDQLLLSVADDGPGIEPDALVRIFDPFFTTKREGTGLGLAVCCAIIHQHGGTLEVESSPGEGSRFSVGLPLGGSPAPERLPVWLHELVPHGEPFAR